MNDDFPRFGEISIGLGSSSNSSSPIKPATLPAPVVSILNKRLGAEYRAHYFYRNAANWCKGVNYPKAALFFAGEAAAELEHAQGIQDFLVAWNETPEIPNVQTSDSFAGLVDVINQAYALELELLTDYSKDQVEFLSLHPASFNFIQGYIDIQNGEVAEYSDLLNALGLIDTHSKLDLLQFEDKYFGA